MSKKIGDATIVDNNETYLIKGLTLPVYVDELGCIYVVEEYENGQPCEHTIEDLVNDGVTLNVKYQGQKK